MAAFLLALREGLEAALIVGILFGTLRKMDDPQPRLRRAVWLGVAAAIGASLLLATGLSLVGLELEGQGEVVFEGIALLLAAAVLTWMIFWMQSQGGAMRARISSEVQHAAMEGGSGSGSRSGQTSLNLFSVAFMTVFREGLELALFLVAAVLASSALETVMGATAGLAVAAGLGVLLFAGAVRLSLKRFFQVTSILLIAFAAGMAAHGAHELIEAGLLPAIVDPIWNTGHLIDEQSLLGQLLKALFGYNSDPTLTELGVYLAYYAAIAVGLWRRHTQSAKLDAIPVRR